MTGCDLCRIPDAKSRAETRAASQFQGFTMCSVEVIPGAITDNSGR
jgi:hypothetical protein